MSNPAFTSIKVLKNRGRIDTASIPLNVSWGSSMQLIAQEEEKAIQKQIAIITAQQKEEPIEPFIPSNPIEWMQL